MSCDHWQVETARCGSCEDTKSEQQDVGCVGARVGWRGPGANPRELTAVSPEAARGSQREHDHEIGQQQYSGLDHEAVLPRLLSPLLALHVLHMEV